MQQTHWSWRDLTGFDGGVPLYVQRYTWDLMQIRNTEANRRNSTPPGQ
jgi:hypothetical protein